MLSDASILPESVNHEAIAEKIRLVEERNKKCAPQRTPDWYLERHNVISASNAYKAIGTPAMRNSIIYEKCEPIPPHQLAPETDAVSDVKSEPGATADVFMPPPPRPKKSPLSLPNTSDPRQWGTMCEPILTKYYEYVNQTTLGEYGCIPHTVHSFLAASPDGINVDPKSALYGRIVEFKCPISRKITGKQKHEYYVQTQLQMEVLDMDECDFVEAKFTLYDTYMEFVNDSTSSTVYGISKGNHVKGQAMTFIAPDRKSILYEYAPLALKYKYEFDDWIAQIIQTRQAEGYESYTPIFWRLDQYSCLLVRRDRAWFKKSLPQFEDTWKTILEERVSGYAHRAPKNKRRKEETAEQNTILISDVFPSAAKTTHADESKNETGYGDIDPDDFPDLDFGDSVTPSIMLGKCAIIKTNFFA